MVQLISLLGNKIPLRLFKLFSDNPRDSFYIEEVRKKLRIAKSSVIKWIHFLENEELLLSKRIGKTIIYSLNFDNPFVKQLRILFVLSELQGVKKMKGFCDSVYLFGSSARGEFLKDSDIDLLVVSNNNITKITSELRKIKTSRSIKPIILSPFDYSMLSRNDPALYNRIEADKVRLL